MLIDAFDPGTQVPLFILAIVFAYPFLIYPLLMRALPLSQASPKPPLVRDDQLPSAALVICALNEEKVIREKLENSLALSYPSGKLRIVLVSDGSTDATVPIAQEYVSRGIELIERPVRRGKVTNLNEVLAARTEDVLVLSDANVFYDTQALRYLVSALLQPGVGAVSGKVVLVGTTADLRTGEEQYYSLEWDLQERASHLHSMAGADGAMYAFWRPLFQPNPPDTIIEDFIIPMSILRQGKRVLFEPRATAKETGVTSVRDEFRRKVRIAAGAAQGMRRGNIWPTGAGWKMWFIFLSHKWFRWFSPVFGLAALIVAALSLHQALSLLVLVGTALLAVLAVLHRGGWQAGVANTCFYFLFGQVALLAGLAKGFTGTQSVMWTKAKR